LITSDTRELRFRVSLERKSINLKCSTKLKVQGCYPSLRETEYLQIFKIPSDNNQIKKIFSIFFYIVFFSNLVPDFLKKESDCSLDINIQTVDCFLAPENW
jgi:hypothetical protein